MFDEREITHEKSKQKVLETMVPHPLLRTKYVVQLTIVFALFFIGINLIAFIFLISEIDEWRRILSLILTISGGTIVFIYVLAIVFASVYTQSMRYTLTSHEIVVEKGVITKSRKIVPYRNVTNFIQKRGLFDRLIGGSDFGTIAIETAGMAGQQTHPEQRLEGIPNTTAYTEKLRNIIAKMKGQASITSDAEIASSLGEEELLTEILSTLKDISKKL